jgi:hypothetical protein
MTRLRLVVLGVLAAATQIARRFFLLRRCTHDRDQIAAQHLGQLLRVASIGLDALAWLDRNQRRRDDLAREPFLRQLPLQRVAARSSRLAARQQHRAVDRVLVGVQPDVRDSFHATGPFVCGWRREALTRDLTIAGRSLHPVYLVPLPPLMLTRLTVFG